MTNKRLNEILKILMEKDESVETAELLNEIKQGYNEPKESKERITKLEADYKALEQKYINTFKNSISDEEPETSAPVQEKITAPESETTFEDIFTD